MKMINPIEKNGQKLWIRNLQKRKSQVSPDRKGMVKGMQISEYLIQQNRTIILHHLDEKLKGLTVP